MRNRFFQYIILFTVSLLPAFLAAQSVSNTIERMDAEMKSGVQSEEKTLWINGTDLTIEGMGWMEGVADYTRLPHKFESVVTSNVWSLSRHSSGISIRFLVSGTTFIEAKWTLTKNNYMAHMTPQATNGVDLYVKQNGKWVWAAIGKPNKDGLEQQTVVRKGFSADKTYECMLYLPLYTGVSSVALGFSEDANVTQAVKNKQKPLVFYGTSILHGCSASRAGMPFSSMLGRHFDMPVVNLGFSGNGLMENHFADILSEIPASVYIIDCLPNMARFSKDEITERTLTLVRKLRQFAPSVPIILVEDRTHTTANLTDVTVENLRRVGQKTAYDVLKTEMENIFYVEGNILLGDDTEATVDGSHPSDLGMYRYFTALIPAVEEALKISK